MDGGTGLRRRRRGICVFSDIPNNRMLRYDECDGSVSVFRQPSNYSNGNTVDRQGRLVTCEHGGRRVVRTEHDGAITVIADRYKGKRLNSPNDVVVTSDGSIWFTDPPYGILTDYEGHKAESEVGGNYVFRVDGATGEIRVVADDFIRPNGLAFSADESLLYIVDSAGGDHPKHIRVFAVGADGTLSGGKEFAVCAAGRFDGMRFDDAGRTLVRDRRRRGLHRRGRDADWPDPDSGDLLERRLRRAEA